jgi:hypothetical protein
MATYLSLYKKYNLANPNMSIADKVTIINTIKERNYNVF